ncbi:MAG: hypothetical protein K6F67_02105, partial [Oscillospiraceae bacterium]|nr:hypothetical protein [Oscillospiraceae bacterium]
MAKSRTLKRALSILLALCLVMSIFTVNVFAETTTNPDGTTTETTVTTNTQDDTPSAGYTTTTTTTTADTTGTITETGATVIGTETRTDMQVTKPSDFVRYGEHTVLGDRTETIASVESDYAPNVTVTLNPGSTATQTATDSSSAPGTHTDTKNGANDPKYDYDQTTTTANRTVTVTAGNVTTTNSTGATSEMEHVVPVDYGRQRISGGVTAPSAAIDSAVSAPGHEGLFYLDGTFGVPGGNTYVAWTTSGKVSERGDGTRVFTYGSTAGGYVRPYSFVFWSDDFRDEATGELKPIAAQCADEPTQTPQKWYKMVNLSTSEATYYVTPTAAAKLRSAAIHGYFSTVSGAGSLAKLKEDLKAYAAAGHDQVYVLNHTKNDPEFTGTYVQYHDFDYWKLSEHYDSINDFIDNASEGEFHLATEAAIWMATRGMWNPDNEPLGAQAWVVYGFDPNPYGREFEARCNYIYQFLTSDYLMNLTNSTPETQIIGTNGSFLADNGLSLTVKDK